MISIEFGHIVIESRLFKDGYFCFTCSLFNPRILYYEIRERLNERHERGVYDG